MGARESRRAAAVRRMLEGTVATVLGGTILWTVTGPMSRSVAVSSSARPPAATFEGESSSATTAAPAGLAIPACRIGEVSSPRAGQNPPALASVAGTAIAPAPLMTATAPGSAPVGSMLLFENFSRYRDGEATDWGPNTYVKTGLDRCKWLVSNVEGAHPVGRTIVLAGEFFFECRYSAYLPESTRGLLGWWREPVATRISLVDSRGAKYTIQWTVGCGNDRRGLNPLASVAAVKYFHSITLPGAAASEVGVSSPTGILRIARCGDVVNVLINGQLAASGMLAQASQFVGFEIDVVMAKSGTLSFTDFKIGR
jgi:hypothetical protein